MENILGSKNKPSFYFSSFDPHLGSENASFHPVVLDGFGEETNRKVMGVKECQNLSLHSHR